MKKHYRAENDCLNCGATLQGKFCHVCGQENLEIKESFGHLMNHAVSDYFHFDDKFFNTLKPLLFKPGKLTNEYMAGKRASYLHPVKMYIFISLVYFLLFFKTDNQQIFRSDPTTTKDIAKIDQSIAANPGYTVQQRKDLIAKVNQYKIVKKANGKTDTVYSYADRTYITSTGDTSYDQYLLTQQKLPAEKRDGFIAKYTIKKIYNWNKKGTDAIKTFGEAFQHNIPKMMFVLLPLFALILMVAFRKNHKFYVEHLIHAFHLHCFVFLFLSMILLIQLVIPPGAKDIFSWIDFIAFITIAWYLYSSLKAVYHRSTGRTILKMIGISLSYSTAYAICMALVVIITAIFEV